MVAIVRCLACWRWHGPRLVLTWSGLGVARARFCGAALGAARSAGAAGVRAGEEGSDARSMTLSFFKIVETMMYND